MPSDLCDVAHLGHAGLRLALAGAGLCVDPPTPVVGPVLLTWSERERTDGARTSTGPLAASAGVLRWVGRDGVELRDTDGVDVAGFRVRARPYRPIPYATPPEAVRKTLSALRDPRLAIERLRHTLRRPPDLPLVLTVDRAGVRVVLLGQALHRFVGPPELAALVAWAGRADLVVAGTDFEDEAATGRMIGAFPARRRVIADLVGTIRRRLGLPVRPLSVALDAAPVGTEGLQARG